MARNDGTSLEEIVALIERQFVDKGWTVELRKKLFNDNGTPVAEFDIEVTGKAGTMDFRMVIECRDRKSEGPQGTGWIEQLVGRRKRFDLNGIMAVSSTGFTEGAVELAKEERVELRTFESLSKDVLSKFMLNMHSCRTIDAHILFRKGEEPSKPGTRINSGEKLVKVKSTGDVWTLNELLTVLVAEHNAQFEVLPDSQKEVEFSLLTDDPCFQLFAEDKFRDIVGGTLKGIITCRCFPAETVGHYLKSDKERVASLIQWNTDEEQISAVFKTPPK